VRFEVLTEVSIEMTDFWNAKQHSLVDRYNRKIDIYISATMHGVILE
jgi:hypothetical protein